MDAKKLVAQMRRAFGIQGEGCAINNARTQVNADTLAACAAIDALAIKHNIRSGELKLIHPNASSVLSDCRLVLELVRKHGAEWCLSKGTMKNLIDHRRERPKRNDYTAEKQAVIHTVLDGNRKLNTVASLNALLASEDGQSMLAKKRQELADARLAAESEKPV